jgi:tRNA(fMet)-specific endonuclease VapC
MCHVEIKSRVGADGVLAISLPLAPFASLPFDDAAAETYGRILAYLAGQGAVIGPNDLLIASIAQTHDTTLATHNVNEFGRVTGLKIEDWQAD